MSGGPGQRAGLLVGDVVLEVNGQNVEAKNVEDVVLLVKEGGNFLSLRITAEANYNKGGQSKRPTSNLSGIEVKVLFLVFYKTKYFYTVAKQYPCLFVIS